MCLWEYSHSVGSHILGDLPALHVSWTGKQLWTIASRASALRMEQKPLLLSVYRRGSHIIAWFRSPFWSFKWLQMAARNCSRHRCFTGWVVTGAVHLVKAVQTMCWQVRSEIVEMMRRMSFIIWLDLGSQPLCICLFNSKSFESWAVWHHGAWKQYTPLLLENPNPKSTLPPLTCYSLGPVWDTSFLLNVLLLFFLTPPPQKNPRFIQAKTVLFHYIEFPTILTAVYLFNLY